ncbi:hypothetical protein ACFL1U_02890 [Patescibacteria group bacterium]
MSRKFNKITLDEIEVLLQYCSGGDEKILRILLDQYRKFKELQTQPRKFGDFTLGDIESVFNKLGNVDDIRSLQQGATHALLKPGKQTLVDRHGFLIPETFGVGKICVHPDREFSAERCELKSVGDLQSRIWHFQTCHEDFRDISFRWDMLKIEIERLVMMIETDRQISNLLHGPWYVVVLPEEEEANIDYLTLKYLVALQDSYLKTIPGGPSIEGLIAEKKPLNYSMRLADQCQHYQFILDKMKHGPVVALYFPLATQGWSVKAIWDSADKLSEKRLYPSGLDALAAMATYPVEMFDGGRKTPSYFLPAVNCSFASAIAPDKQARPLLMAASSEMKTLSVITLYDELQTAAACTSGGLCFIG